MPTAVPTLTATLGLRDGNQVGAIDETMGCKGSVTIGITGSGTPKPIQRTLSE